MNLIERAMESLQPNADERDVVPQALKEYEEGLKAMREQLLARVQAAGRQ